MAKKYKITIEVSEDQGPSGFAGYSFEIKFNDGVDKSEYLIDPSGHPYYGNLTEFGIKGISSCATQIVDLLLEHKTEYKTEKELSILDSVITYLEGSKGAKTTFYCDEN